MKTVYKNVNILDGTKNMSVQENMDVLVENGIITSVGKDLKGDNEVDLSNKYLMPGLINMHVHIPANGFPKEKETDNKKLAKLVTKTKFTQRVAKKLLCDPNMKVELLSGCTTIRAVGGVGHIDTMIRDDINKGKVIGPRLISCDYAITIPDGHMEGTVAVAANTKEEFISLVKDNVDHNVDWIKIMVTGGVLDAKVKGEPGEMKMTSEQVKVCVEEAHKYGLKVCAHAESTKGVEVALENGADCIEHGSYLSDKAINLFKENNATLVCTISPAIPLAKLDERYTKATDITKYNSEYLLEGMISGVKACLDSGVNVGLGTDVGCPFVTHYDMWREMEYLHKLCNVDRKDVLHIATLNNAQLLDIDKETGSIEKGKSADFIVATKNPLEGFDALRELDLVVFKGKEYKEPHIDKYEICEEQLDKYLSSLNDSRA